MRRPAKLYVWKGAADMAKQYETVIGLEVHVELAKIGRAHV